MASGKGAGIAKSTILVLFTFPPFRRLWKPEIQKSKGPWKWLLEKERVLQNRQFWCFCGVPPSSAALEAGNPRNTRGLGNSGKERVLQNRRFWCFCGVPPISAALEARNPGNPTGLEMGSGKGAGIAKSTIFVLSWGSPPFRRPWKPEIQEIQGALEMASGKGAGIAKSTIFVLFVVFPPCRRPQRA